MFSGYTFASCSSISDSDQRNYCQATQEGSTCSSIRDSDLRASCEAEKGSTCSSIRDSDQRAYCEAKKGSTCSSIRDSDLRATCEAEKGSTCSSIHDSDQRAFCEAKKGSTCSSIRNSDLRNQCEAMKHLFPTIKSKKGHPSVSLFHARLNAAISPSNAHPRSRNQSAPAADAPRRSNTWSLGRCRGCSAPWRFCLCWWSEGWPGIPE